MARPKPKSTLPKGPKSERVLIFQPEEHPDTGYPNVPDDDRFVEHGGDFCRAKDIESIAALLMDHYDAEFGALRQLAIGYAWKRKGGSSSGASTLGKCVKASGLMRFYSDCEFVIWLAADHLRELNEGPEGARLPATCWQLEALVFHELKHIAVDSETGEVALRAHDFEGFRGEVLQYGPWKRDVEEMRAAYGQMSMQLVTS